MLGEGSNRVADLGTAQGQAILPHGRGEAVLLEEVDRSTTAPILREYMRLRRAQDRISPSIIMLEFRRIDRFIRCSALSRTPNELRQTRGSDTEKRTPQRLTS